MTGFLAVSDTVVELRDRYVLLAWLAKSAILREFKSVGASCMLIILSPSVAVVPMNSNFQIAKIAKNETRKRNNVAT